MSAIGVIECFFGPRWSERDRVSYAEFLRENRFEFYIYAPKSDSLLRRSWMAPWRASFLETLAAQARVFRAQGIRYGVGLSPFGLVENLNEHTLDTLKQKLDQLLMTGLDQIALIFDDMPLADGLADRQVEIVEKVRTWTAAPIVFCPTYSSHDPVLDQVFGKRPDGYLERIGKGVPPGIDILWTGPKVISPEISERNLEEVGRILRRKPFVCDNLFANDGPSNCKYLKLITPIERSDDALSKASAWAFNPMNQAQLSKIVLAAAELAIKRRAEPSDALDQAMQKLCSPVLLGLLRANRAAFASEGLDRIPDESRKALASTLRKMTDPAAPEIAEWLEGGYSVGEDCLTD